VGGEGWHGAGWAAAQLTWFVPLMLVLAVLMLAWLGTVTARLGKLDRHYRRLTDGVDDGDLLAALERLLGRLQACEARLDAAEGRLAEAEEAARWPLQDYGLVRFDAFDDVGGEVSFAVVMLDDRGEGIALSSLFGRDGSSTYAKRVGPQTRAEELSDEEREAWTVALRRAEERKGRRRNPRS